MSIEIHGDSKKNQEPTKRPEPRGSGFGFTKFEIESSETLLDPVQNSEKNGDGKAVTVSEQKVLIPTYAEAEAESLPMFAENRVHQRTSGRPYPNCVVLTAEREHQADKCYTVIHLENQYLSIGILPELGGRVFWAKDKTTGYDFFYRQYVIKPALIGALGSWISGGVEFNFPFHHRPSTFMPVDYAIEEAGDGSVTVWLSEHDPINRMKGMVGIRLHPDEAMFETRVQLSNRTSVPQSFLWWENAAVPVNENYQIFFPQDVSHVNFHYHQSVTTWPLASGVYNGNHLGENTDIQQHKNTRYPTSYFSAASEYDFFGGYDHGEKCGVVHVANHHISPGKKLFTWAYNQLSKSWEKALTDTDGAYAELMAGSYSDNQPDFAWLEPYETKKFSQYWYPIGAMGVPVCANTNGAISLQRSSEEIVVAVQTVREHRDALLLISIGETVLCKQSVDLLPGQPLQVHCVGSDGLLSIRITEKSGAPILGYAENPSKAEGLPDPWEDLPRPEQLTTAQELHIAGVHVDQYRSPNALPDVYWQTALQRDPNYVPALIDLGRFYYKRGFFDLAEELLQKARSVITRHNQNPRNSEAFYLLGLVLLAQDKTKKAYDVFYKATWSESHRSQAFTMLAALDGRRGDFKQMLDHAMQALETSVDNPLANPLAAAAELRLGAPEAAIARLKYILSRDPLNHLARYLECRALNKPLTGFYATLKSSPSQTCLDLAYDLLHAGLHLEARELLEGLPSQPVPMTCYTLGVLYLDSGNEDQANLCFARAEQMSLGKTFPFRLEELKVLRRVLEHDQSLSQAWFYLGCLLYDKGHYEEAAECWQKNIAADEDFYASYRNLAVEYYSHLDRKNEVLPLLEKALAFSPSNKQLVYETSHVMAKLGISPAQRIAFLGEHSKSEPTRDDIVLEHARALNQMGQSDQALELLLSHSFVPCEGGEHAVAEQYMFAHHNLGRMHLRKGQYGQALTNFRNAQVLPDQLGAGLWHQALLVPHQYYESLCLIHLGNVDRAKDLCRYIVSLPIEYFSEMHLPEQAVYQAMAKKLLGQEALATQELRILLTRWSNALKQTDAGCFKTTPFFISYIDSPRLARAAHFHYLLGMAKAALEDQAGAKDEFQLSVESDPSRLYPWMELQFICYDS